MTIDLNRSWQLDRQVALRAERFGALAYHFGTRRLSFLKSPKLVKVVCSLADQPSGLEACRAAGVSESELPAYALALDRLLGSGMLVAQEQA